MLTLRIATVREIQRHLCHAYIKDKDAAIDVIEAVAMQVSSFTGHFKEPRASEVSSCHQQISI